VKEPEIVQEDSAGGEPDTLHIDTLPPPATDGIGPAFATYAYPPAPLPSTAIPVGESKPEPDVAHDDGVGGEPDSWHTDTLPPPAPFVFTTNTYPSKVTLMPQGPEKPDMKVGPPDVGFDNTGAGGELDTCHTDTAPENEPDETASVTYAYPPNP
jgi:hypothetical protein